MQDLFNNMKLKLSKLDLWNFSFLSFISSCENFCVGQ